MSEERDDILVLVDEKGEEIPIKEEDKKEEDKKEGEEITTEGSTTGKSKKHHKKKHYSDSQICNSKRFSHLNPMVFDAIN